MYSSRVGEGNYVLVALEHAKNATPVALGGYVVGSGQWEQAQPPCPTPTRLVYMLPQAAAFFSQDNLCPTPHAQVVGMSNRRPDDATSLRFREYLPTLDTRSMPSARSSSAVMRRRGSLSCCSARSKKGRA